MSGKLAQAGRLEVSLTVVGSYELDRDSVELDDSDGCKRATHVVSTLSAGAFELSSGGESEAAAGVGVGGAGVRAEKQSRREVLNRAGDESACEGARSGDAAPPPGCGALLRVVLRPARRPKPAAATVEPAPVVGEAPKEPKAPKEPTDGGAPTTEPVAAREPAVEPATPERSTPPLADETRARPAEPSRPEPAQGSSTGFKIGVGVGVALLVGALVAGIVVGATRDTTTKHTAAPTGGLGSAKLSAPGAIGRAAMPVGIRW